MSQSNEKPTKRNVITEIREDGLPQDPESIYRRDRAKNIGYGVLGLGVAMATGAGLYLGAPREAGRAEVVAEQGSSYTTMSIDGTERALRKDDGSKLTDDEVGAAVKAAHDRARFDSGLKVIKPGDKYEVIVNKNKLNMTSVEIEDKKD